MANCGEIRTGIPVSVSSCASLTSHEPALSASNSKFPPLPLQQSKTKKETIQEFLSKQCRKIIPAKPDGNCLFRSLAKLLTGDEEEYLMIKNMLLDFELTNSDIFSNYITTETLLEHINAIRPNNAWGSNTEILAAATLCQLPIYVACDTNPNGCWKVYKPLTKHCSPPFVVRRGWLELSYTNNSHFDAVQPVNNSVVLSQPIIIPRESYENDIL